MEKSVDVLEQDYFLLHVDAVHLMNLLLKVAATYTAPPGPLRLPRVECR